MKEYHVDIAERLILTFSSPASNLMSGYSRQRCDLALVLGFVYDSST